MRVAVIDVGIGNMKSVSGALEFLGAAHELVSQPAALEGATHVILPGVGAFGAGMRALHDAGMVEALHAYHAGGARAVLGICLGMQLLTAHSEEGQCDGLGLLPSRIEKMRAQAGEFGSVKVPHVGFSTLHDYRPDGLFADLPQDPDFYFTHSYALKTIADPTVNRATCVHGDTFIAAFQAGRLCGAQFHPEKSQTNGLRFLKNFLSLDSATWQRNV